MVNKKSGRLAVYRFRQEVSRIRQFIQAIRAAGLPKVWLYWSYDYAVIQLNSAFERLITVALIAAINNDTTTISERTGIRFPPHLTDEICEYLVTGGGFLDMRGREGMIRTLKELVPANHYLVQIVKNPQYTQALERLVALRNLAAHGSKVSKMAARRAVGMRLLSSGAWLSRGSRFDDIASKLEALATDIRAQAWH